MSNQSIYKVKDELPKYVKGHVTFFQWISTQIAYDILTKKRYFLSHEQDPSWDASGKLYVDHFGFNVKDYHLVADFMKEFDGHSYPTYQSGHGIKYTTYFDRYRKILKKIDKHHQDPDITLKKIGKTNFLFLYRKGKVIAEKIIQQDIKEAQQEQENKKKAQKMWRLLDKKYRLMFQKPIPSRIKHSNFKQFNQFLSEQNLTREEWAFIAQYAPISVSNRVRSKLKFG